MLDSVAVPGPTHGVAKVAERRPPDDLARIFGDQGGHARLGLFREPGRPLRDGVQCLRPLVRGRGEVGVVDLGDLRQICGRRVAALSRTPTTLAQCVQPRLVRPRRAAKHIDMLIAPTMPMAIRHLPRLPQRQPLDTSARWPFEHVGHRVPRRDGVEPAAELAAGHVRRRHEQEREEQQEARVDRRGVAGLEGDRVAEAGEGQAPQRRRSR